MERQCRLLRCIFSNPIRPITAAPTWQTGNVCSLAQAAYDNRSIHLGLLDNDRLLILLRFVTKPEPTPPVS